MNLLASGALGATWLLSLCASTAPSVVPSSQWPTSSPSIHGVGKGLPVCVDCRAPAMSVTVCHTSNVSVSIGNNQIGSFGTGQSSSVCVTAPSVGPDQCVWIEYHYSCSQQGLFGLWKCSPTGTNVVVGENPFC